MQAAPRRARRFQLAFPGSSDPANRGPTAVRYDRNVLFRVASPAIALALVNVVAVACRFDAADGTGYRCELTSDCPPGQFCIDTICTTGGGSPDADAAADANANASPSENLVVNPDLEEALVAPWTAWEAELAVIDDSPHGGRHALEACLTGESGFTAYQPIVTGTVPIGARYRASVWVRSSPLALDRPPGTINLTLRETGGATDKTDHDGVTSATVGGEWFLLTVEAVVEQPDRENVVLIVWARESTAGACFAADDAFAYRPHD